MLIYSQNDYLSKDLDIIREQIKAEINKYYLEKNISKKECGKNYILYKCEVVPYDYINLLINVRNKYNFKSDFEKDFFVNNFLFPSDEAFLKIVNKSNSLELLNSFVKDFIWIDKIDNAQRKKLVKQTLINNFVKQNYLKLKEMREYFNLFYKINSAELILNRLLQIYYLNDELYINYIKENKKQKVKQI